MGRKYSVSRLEEISFTACLKDILGNLLLCPEHRPESSRHLNSYSSLISIHPNLFSSSNVRSFVRNRLNQHLIGIMNDDIRKRLVCEFNCSFPDNFDQKSDIWVFLDCVLDSSFTELETHVVFPKSELNEKLVQIICHHSPNIRTLKLNFEMVMKKTPLEKLKPIVTSLSSFVHLTSLSLYCLNKRQRNMLNFVGYSCPKLQHFCITGFPIVKKDILALVIGDALNLFPVIKEIMLEEESDIHKFRISPEFLTPLCSTLQHLQLEDLGERNRLKKSCEFTGLPYSAVAFVLCHMKNLHRIDHSSSSVSSAVNFLSRNSEEKYVERNSVNGSLSLIHSMTENVSFSGILSLTYLDFVDISSVEMMKTVGRMCPGLKEVTFSQLLNNEDITPDQIFEILTREWPKVERVTFIKVSPNYRKAVLLGIGAHLSNLTFASCESIDIADLVACTALEVLRILFSSTLFLPENPLEKFSVHNAFLPKLYHLESDICLHERYSHLFEEKRSMTHLELDCCHVNTKANTMNWNDVTKCWQRIQILRIRQCTGLGMTSIKSLPLQLTKLKELYLPSGMLNSKEERESYYEMMDYFNEGPLKVQLKFVLEQSSIDCPYQAPSCPYESSSDEELSSQSDESSQRQVRVGFSDFIPWLDADEIELFADHDPWDDDFYADFYADVEADVLFDEDDE